MRQPFTRTNDDPVNWRTGTFEKKLKHKTAITNVCFYPFEKMQQQRYEYFRQTSNICRALLSNTSVYHSDAVGASAVGAAHRYLHFRLNICFQWIGQRQLQDETRNI